MQEHSSQVLRDTIVPAPISVDLPRRSERPSGAFAVPGGHGDATRRFGHLRVSSPAMHGVIDVLGRLSPTDVTVTLVGETGSGKDVIANAVHAESARASGPFVVFDCGSVAANLAESELLGHERGSFTGAVTSYAGAFERANGGTLFLDEIGELPLDLQPRLLRVLENRRVRRVGGGQDRPVDVRVIAATNRDLPADVSGGRFRQDLFFRLAGAIVPIPPLRNRLDDLETRVPSLLESLGHPDLIVAAECYEALKAHSWPGNVRELKNTLACALAFLDGSVLEPRHLSFLAQVAQDDVLERVPLAGRTLSCIERAAIKQTLVHTGGNKLRAARALGIAVSTLYEKLKKHGL